MHGFDEWRRVYYEVDGNLSKHVLELETYASGADAETDSWVLLSKVDDDKDDVGIVSTDEEDEDEDEEKEEEEEEGKGSY